MIAINGKEVPHFNPDEDIKAITLKLILDLTGVVVAESQVKDCHRMGEKILLSFVQAGTCSPISKILCSNRRNQHRLATWINIHQSPHDAKLSFIARRMKKAKILDFVGSSLGALTRVGKDGRKYIINTEEDLQKLTDRPISSFLKGAVSHNDSGVSMEN